MGGGSEWEERRKEEGRKGQVRGRRGEEKYLCSAYSQSCGSNNCCLGLR